MNRINQLFETKQKDIVSIYFTAGHPAPNTTKQIITALQDNKVDMLEIGMPYSDPLADGFTIQQSSQQALEQGMSLIKLFDEIKDIRQTVQIPLLLMGYFNTVLKYGIEQFCKDASAIGIDGVILPDMPLEVYERQYKAIFEQYDIIPVFLVTPQTSEERIRETERLSKGFIYIVSTAATTGAQVGYAPETMAYFQRIEAMKLNVPCVTGFGISNKKTLEQASAHAAGAIIGSAFVKAIDASKNIDRDVAEFFNIFKS